MTSHASLLIATSLAGALIIVTALAQDGQGGAEAWVAPARAAKKKNPITADEASLARGRQLYIQECLSCHGPAGKGDGPSVKDLEKTPEDLALPKIQTQTDGALFWKISEGRKPMPSLAQKWTEEQRWQVVNYMRTLVPRSGDNAKDGQRDGKR